MKRLDLANALLHFHVFTFKIGREEKKEFNAFLSVCTADFFEAILTKSFLRLKTSPSFQSF